MLILYAMISLPPPLSLSLNFLSVFSQFSKTDSNPRLHYRLAQSLFHMRLVVPHSGHYKTWVQITVDVKILNVLIFYMKYNDTHVTIQH